jgi:hypothetical protein
MGMPASLPLSEAKEVSSREFSAPAKKPPAKQAAAKKVGAATKAVAKKPPVKKTVAKKAIARRTPAKAPAKVVKKTVAKSAPNRKGPTVPTSTNPYTVKARKTKSSRRENIQKAGLVREAILDAEEEGFDIKLVLGNVEDEVKRELPEYFNPDGSIKELNGSTPLATGTTTVPTGTDPTAATPDGLPTIEPNTKPKPAPGVPRGSEPDMEGTVRGQAWEAHKAPNGGIYITSGEKTIVVGELRWHNHHTEVLKELIPNTGLSRLRNFQLGGKSSSSSTD